MRGAREISLFGVADVFAFVVGFVFAVGWVVGRTVPCGTTVTWGVPGVPGVIDVMGAGVSGPAVGGTVGAVALGASNVETTRMAATSNAVSTTTTTAARSKPRLRFGCGRRRIESSPKGNCPASVPNARLASRLARPPNGSLESAASSRRGRALYLKSIDISGFKSFARPARLELPPGITAFVGPNGSGKSNVVDAIRWCLGEQSMRDLRGQRAEDVIHAGAHRLLGMAEVALTFESDRSDPPSIPASLGVSRRLFRSGESEYLVNKRKSRLRDLQDALRSVGIDGGRHVVVTQGMADALLSATPAERRSLLEQAAGLAGYRARREEARQKLATTAQNVATIEVVLGELEPRLRLLRRQSRAVQDREDATSRLRAALILWYGALWRRKSEHVRSLELDMERVGRQRGAAEASLRLLEERSERALELERAWRASLDATEAGRHAVQRDHDQGRFLLQRAEQLQASAGAARADASARMDRLLAALTDARARLDGSTTLLQSLDAEHIEAVAAAQRLQETRDETALNTVSARRSMREIREVSERATQDATLTHRELESIRHRLSLQDLRLAEIESERKDVSEAEAHADARLAALRTQSETATAGAEEASAAFLRARTELDTEVGRLERVDRIAGRLRTRMSELERAVATQLRTLEALGDEIGGSLINAISVEERWEDAVAAALGTWIASGSGGLEAATWTEDRRSSFFAWRTSITSAIGGNGVWADAVVRRLSLHAVNPLAATLLVETREDAERAWSAVCHRPADVVGSPPLQIAVRSGEVRTACGWEMARADDRAARYFALKDDLNRSRRGLELTQARARLLAGARDDMATRVESDRVRAEEAGRTAEHARGAFDSLRKDLDDVERTCTRLRREAAGLHEQWQRTREERESSGRELRAHEEADAQAASRSAEVQGQVHAARAQADKTRIAQEDAEERLSVARQNAQGIEAGIAAQKELVAALAAECDRLETERAKLSRETSRLDGDIERSRREAADGAANLADLASILAEHDRRIQQVRSQRPAADDLTSLATPRAELTALVARHEALLARYRHARTDLDDLSVEIERELGLEESSLPQSGEDAPSEDEIRRLRFRANQYADADASVVRECADLEERYTGLQTNLEDLRAASETLDEIMQSTDAEMRRRFEAAFTEVDREFGRVFEVMLRGGSASLEIVDDDGGVGVNAHLPGKRSRSSAAFSGGERALVASSLLFGVLRMRPTPFCVLDEVDAALDESNVDRYLSALRDISSRTQTIVVTHNRATMAAADALYGLTMDDDGASSLLSLRLDAYEPAV